MKIDDSKQWEGIVASHLQTVKTLQQSLAVAVAKLAVAQSASLGLTDPAKYTNPSQDYGPNADTIEKLIKEIMDNPNHYLYPFK